MGYVLVHGFTQTARSWDVVRRDLAAAVAVDVPDGLDFVSTAHAIGEAGGAATYVGYSMGGRLCLQLALDRPDIVEHLVMVSATPGIADPKERARRAASDEGLAVDLEREGVEAFLERWLAQPMFATLPRAASGVDNRRLGNSVGRLAHQLRVLGQGAQPSNWDRLDTLAPPLLLLAGALDTKYAAIAAAVHARLPHSSTVHVVAGAGHALHLERPDVTAHLITSW